MPKAISEEQRDALREATNRFIDESRKQLGWDHGDFPYLTLLDFLGDHICKSLDRVGDSVSKENGERYDELLVRFNLLKGTFKE